MSECLSVPVAPPASAVHSAGGATSGNAHPLGRLEASSALEAVATAERVGLRVVLGARPGKLEQFPLTTPRPRAPQRGRETPGLRGRWTRPPSVSHREVSLNRPTLGRKPARRPGSRRDGRAAATRFGAARRRAGRCRGRRGVRRGRVVAGCRGARGRYRFSSMIGRHFAGAGSGRRSSHSGRARGYVTTKALGRGHPPSGPGPLLDPFLQEDNERPAGSVPRGSCWARPGELRPTLARPRPLASLGDDAVGRHGRWARP